MLSKETRQKALTELIRTQKIATQQHLQRAMEDAGIQTTQASLSRDISEMGILKESGFYVLHPASFYQGGILQVLSVQSAGPNLLVVKTAPGSASTIGLGIDESRIDGVVGTLAGDDTLFVAISSLRKATQIKKEILKKFRPKTGH